MYAIRSYYDRAAIENPYRYRKIPDCLLHVIGEPAGLDCAGVDLPALDISGVRRRRRIAVFPVAVLVGPDVHLLRGERDAP